MNVRTDPGQSFFWMMMALIFAADFDRPHYICKCGDHEFHRIANWNNMNVMMEMMILEVNKCLISYGPTLDGD